MDASWLSHSPYLAAALVGWLGGVHCLAMCGGIVGALSLGQRQAPAFPTLLAYNMGRLASYTLAGAVVGGLGTTVLMQGQLQQAQQILGIVAALFMLSLGLYIAGVWQGTALIERLGARLWRYIEPLGRRFIPVKGPQQALPLGMVWGWLPCGLVYSVLLWSLASGSFIKGALLMLAFGLGTLPNLLLMGFAAQSLRRWTQHRWVRLIAGFTVGLLGLLLLWQSGSALFKTSY